MRVTSVESTELFVGSAEHPRQVVTAEIGHTAGRTVRLTAEGPGVRADRETLATVADDGTLRVQIPVNCDLPPGERTHVTVTAEDTEDPDQRASLTGGLLVADPGWTMFMVSHFHYDPVWWNTQAAYTETWDITDDPATSGLPARTFDSRGQSGMSLVRAHIDLARRGPAYT
jgi:hypothetical protein